MASKIEQLRAKAEARRRALCADLGLSSSQQLTEALHSKSERRKLNDEKAQIQPVEKKRPKKREDSSTPEYTDSSTFLKGTNSKNPHNDYCQNFIDTGQVSHQIHGAKLKFSIRQIISGMYQWKNDSPSTQN